MTKKNRSKAIQAINSCGILLVYPLANQKEPKSLWSELFPKTKMRWEWDSDGDDRVAQLWMLRADLSTSREVVYMKWFQNRATFFSREVFVWMLAFMRADQPLPQQSQQILEVLEMDSPLSTKQIKEATELQGKLFESTYDRAMKVLWKRMWIVAFGEVEDSSFPSLAVGATRLIFEELWDEAQAIDPEVAEKNLIKKLGLENKFWKFAEKVKKELQSPVPTRKGRHKL